MHPVINPNWVFFIVKDKTFLSRVAKALTDTKCQVSVFELFIQHSLFTLGTQCFWKWESLAWCYIIANKTPLRGQNYLWAFVWNSLETVFWRYHWKAMRSHIQMPTNGSARDIHPTHGLPHSTELLFCLSFGIISNSWLPGCGIMWGQNQIPPSSHLNSIHLTSSHKEQSSTYSGALSLTAYESH